MCLLNYEHFLKERYAPKNKRTLYSFKFGCGSKLKEIYKVIINEILNIYFFNKLLQWVSLTYCLQKRRVYLECWELKHLMADEIVGF